MSESEKPKEDRRAVIDGRLVYTSVSAMQKADNDGEGCLRAWFYKYVLRMPDKPPGKGQIRGQQGHKRIEEYLLTGKHRFDRVELEGLNRGLFPEPNVRHVIEEQVERSYTHPIPVLVEEHFGKPTPLHAIDVPMTGYVDLVDPRALKDTGVLVIRDWKFKKSIADYACKKEDLINPNHEAGIQMLGYAEWARKAQELGRFAHPFTVVSLGHTTFQTQGRTEVDAVSIAITLTEAADSWETVTRRIIPGMKAAARETNAQSVPCNTKVCQKYGGCAFLDACQDRMARIAARFKINAPAGANAGATRMGMLDQIVNQTATTPIQPQSAAPAPAAPAPDPRTQANVVRAGTIIDLPPGGLLAKECVQGQQYTVDGHAATYLCQTTMAGRAFASFIPMAGGSPLLIALETVVIDPSYKAPAQLPIILPPDAPASKPELAAKLTASDGKPGQKYVIDDKGTIGECAGVTSEVCYYMTPGGLLKLAPTAPIKLAPASAPVTTQPVQSAPVAQVVASPAVPGPIQTESVAPAEAPKKRGRPKKEETTVVVPAPIQTESAAAVASEMASVEGFNLYFVGSPIGVPVQTLTAYVDEIDRTFREAVQLTNIPDIRANSSQDFGFGKWKPYFAKACLEQLPPPGHYIVTPGDERIQIAAEVLLAKASLVVR